MRIFIIGCGRILQKHLDSIKVLSSKLKVVGVADLKKNRLNNIAKKLNTNKFIDYQEGIKKTNPDIVSILTPSGFHAKHIIDVKEGVVPDIFLSVQANSPTISSKEIDKCIDALIEYNRDEIISVDSNLMQDASIRVFKSSYVFQRDLSTNCGVVITDLYDVHNHDDVLAVENILSKRIV